MLVQSVMTRSVVTTEPDHSLRSAARLMREGGFRHLPIVRGGSLVGIISDREVSREQDGSVAEVMRTDVITVSPETPVEVAASLLIENKIGALPVVDPTAGNLVGIVSQTDLFAILVRLLGGDSPSTRLELRLDDLPRQLALVASIAQRYKVGINSLVTVPRNGAECHIVVLRIETMVARPFVDALRQAGIGVDAPERGDA